MTVVDAESRFHVLAVDDSLIDRKLIEMLLKNSSYQGECVKNDVLDLGFGWDVCVLCSMFGFFFLISSSEFSACLLLVQ